MRGLGVENIAVVKNLCISHEPAWCTGFFCVNLNVYESIRNWRSCVLNSKLRYGQMWLLQTSAGRKKGGNRS